MRLFPLYSVPHFLLQYYTLIGYSIFYKILISVFYFFFPLTIHCHNSLHEFSISLYFTVGKNFLLILSLVVFAQSCSHVLSLFCPISVIIVHLGFLFYANSILMLLLLFCRPSYFWYSCMGFCPPKFNTIIIIIIIIIFNYWHNFRLPSKCMVVII